MKLIHNKIMLGNVIITNNSLGIICHLLILKVTNKTILLSNRSNHSTTNNTKPFGMYKTTILKHCTNKHYPWKILTKQEYIEKYI